MSDDINRTQLSYSSWSQLSTCEMQYAHRKIYNTPVDEEEDRTAFDVGSATHYCVEKTLWGVRPLDQSIVDCAIKEYPCAADFKALVHAMANKLIEQQTLSGLVSVFVELKIETTQFLGFIDLIAKDEFGRWYIIDLKTSSTPPSDGLLARLPLDRQLNLYASFAGYIASAFDLDFEKFQGCIYRVVVKSKANQKAKESYEDFILRMGHLIKVYDVYITKDMMNTKEIVTEFNEAYERSLELRNGVAPKKNYGACFNYFRLCPYFSQCHSAKSEDLVKKIKVITTSEYLVQNKNMEML